MLCAAWCLPSSFTTTAGGDPTTITPDTPVYCLNGSVDHTHFRGASLEEPHASSTASLGEQNPKRQLSEQPLDLQLVSDVT